MTEIFGALASVQGSAIVTLEVLDIATERLRMTLHGRVELALDRAAFESGSLTIGLSVPGTFGVGQAQISLGSQRTTPSAVRPGVVELPVRVLEASGALDHQFLRAQLASNAGLRTTLDIGAQRDVILLRQSH